MRSARAVIGNKVRALRETRRWSQAELADQLGLAQGQLSKIENGQASLTAEQFLSLLSLFNVDVGHFVSESRDPVDVLHNALARMGASHLHENPEVLPSGHLADVPTLVREVLALGESRAVTALAPVLVRHLDENSAGRVNLRVLRARLATSGLERRLSWLNDSIAQALRETLLSPLPRRWSTKYRRALLLLETDLGSTDLPASPSAMPESAAPPQAVDILDGHIRSKQGLDETWFQASPISRRWGIATSLQPRDFIDALRAAREAG